MRANSRSIDKPLALLIALLVGAGSMIFASAAFGLLARGQGGMYGVIFNHLVLGVGVGIVLLVVCLYVDYHQWRNLAPYLYSISLLATALVFVPHLGAMHGGGRRWIVLGGASVQPSETLKLCGVIMAAAYYAALRNKVVTFRYGLGGFFAILAPPALILLLQPDLGTLGVVACGIGVVYFMAGARLRDIALVIIIGILALGVLALVRPYVRDRVMTFFHPSAGEQAEGYQIRQALIAIGSGGFFGRGFGQSIQKFTYLPEPMGDSIFAVAAEELGFLGALLLIALFIALALRGFAVASHAPDLFGALLASGISSTLIIEALINISAMLGVVPLTGIPLTFISQGGTAMIVALASAGVLLNISKMGRKSAKIAG
jgi:cell division protein FtsW